MISQECIDFLKEVGADEKSWEDKSLLDHLIETHDILKDNGAPEYLQKAGLFHSIYGTVYFMDGKGLVQGGPPCHELDERYKIKNLIGDKAEEIVWWYCFIDEPRVEKIQELEDQQLKHDLNFLESCHEQLSSLSRVEEMSWEEAYNL